MVEIARDRFTGYPKTLNDDSLAPFYDAENKVNMYPLQSNPLPLEWDFSTTLNGEGNVNHGNYAEHVQDRWSWYDSNPRLSTESAFYSMQGACDPKVTNSTAMEYYPNCSDANNDISTGGIIAPTPTNQFIYQKSADLSPFLKALYEYHQYIKQLGYYFSNSGAGSSMMIPHYALDGTSEYVSLGCEWMRAPNPNNPDLGPIGTDEDISRCHPEGVVVPTREYNPLERQWCRDQVLNPNRVHCIGPYIDAWSKEKRWLMSAGRAVYDIETGAFISCIAVDFSVGDIAQVLVLDGVKVDDLGTLTLVRNDDLGTVVWSPNFDFEVAESTTTIDDPLLETGVDAEMFNAFRSKVDWSRRYDPKEVLQSFNTPLADNDETIIAAYPIPPVPEEYDPSYIPEMYAIFTVPRAKGLDPTLEGLNDEVDKSVKSIVIFTLIVGMVGIFIVLVMIMAISSWFTKPLKRMNKVGDQVVGRFGQEDEAGIDYTREALVCSPKTELTALEDEFSLMISRFSGDSTSKRVKISDEEKMNVFDFANEFSGLYQSRKDGSFGFGYTRDSTAQDATSSNPTMCNLGTNTKSSSSNNKPSKPSATFDEKTYNSPLFHWMAGLIASPVLIATIIISAVVLSEISNALPSLIAPIKEEYFDITQSYRSTAAGLLALKASEVTQRAARDIHVLTRFFSWALFGGIQLKNSFGSVAMLEGAEECKVAPSVDECEWIRGRPCDCAWNDFTARGEENACTNYRPAESRAQQLLHFAGQRTSTWPDGTRNFTTFPDVASSPNTTAWWDNVTVLPRQASEEFNNTKYGTTYDRVRIVSALSTVFIPLYNYE